MMLERNNSFTRHDDVHETCMRAPVLPAQDQTNLDPLIPTVEVEEFARTPINVSLRNRSEEINFNQLSCVMLCDPDLHPEKCQKQAVLIVIVIAGERIMTGPPNVHLTYIVEVKCTFGGPVMILTLMRRHMQP